MHLIVGRLAGGWTGLKCKKRPDKRVVNVVRKVMVQVVPP